MLNYLIAITILLASSTSFAADTDFSQYLDKFPNGQPPALSAQDMAPRALCYDSFAILHSGKSRTPIYVAQRLNKAQVEAQIVRTDAFFADARLPQKQIPGLKAALLLK